MEDLSVQSTPRNQRSLCEIYLFKLLTSETNLERYAAALVSEEASRVSKGPAFWALDLLCLFSSHVVHCSNASLDVLGCPATKQDRWALSSISRCTKNGEVDMQQDMHHIPVP